MTIGISGQTKDQVLESLSCQDHFTAYGLARWTQRFKKLHQSSGSQIMVPGPEPLPPLGNLLEMQILRPYPRPTESGTWEEWDPGIRLNRPFKRF